jgi:hypothetical protein
MIPVDGDPDRIRRGAWWTCRRHPHLAAREAAARERGPAHIHEPLMKRAETLADQSPFLRKVTREFKANGLHLEPPGRRGEEGDRAHRGALSPCRARASRPAHDHERAGGRVQESYPNGRAPCRMD